jgi:hypothetical protein
VLDGRRRSGTHHRQFDDRAGRTMILLEDESPRASEHTGKSASKRRSAPRKRKTLWSGSRTTARSWCCATSRCTRFAWRRQRETGEEMVRLWCRAFAAEVDFSTDYQLGS